MTLSRLASAAGLSKGYLSMVEHDLRAASEETLTKLEAALGLRAGALVARARWRAVPEEVKREVSQLQETERIALRLADILEGSGLDAEGRLRGSLDAAYRSGELRRLVERVETRHGGTQARRHEEKKETEGRNAAGDGSVPSCLRASVPPCLISSCLPFQVPLINKVAAGYPADFTDLGYPARVADEYVRAPALEGEGDADAFAARVVGDSMSPEYREGDIVVFSPAREVKSGMDCFARLEPDQQTTFKRVYFEDGGRIRLQPLNPAYPPRLLEREEVAGLYAAVSVTRVV